jgi:hypothetical protein
MGWTQPLCGIMWGRKYLAAVLNNVMCSIELYNRNIVRIRYIQKEAVVAYFHLLY